LAVKLLGEPVGVARERVGGVQVAGVQLDLGGVDERPQPQRRRAREARGVERVLARPPRHRELPQRGLRGAEVRERGNQEAALAGGAGEGHPAREVAGGRLVAVEVQLGAAEAVGGFQASGEPVVVERVEQLAGAGGARLRFGDLAEKGRAHGERGLDHGFVAGVVELRVGQRLRGAVAVRAGVVGVAGLQR